MPTRQKGGSGKVWNWAWIWSFCYNACVSKKKKKTRRDTAEIARSVVEQATRAETLTPREEEPEEQPEEDTCNQAAVALSKLGASKGGRARAQSLSKKRRKEIARKAAKVRWS